MNITYTDDELEACRFVRYLIWKNGLGFNELTDSFIFFFRNDVTKIINDSNGSMIYVLDHGTDREIILNTEDEYKEYLAAQTTPAYLEYIVIQQKHLGPVEIEERHKQMIGFTMSDIPFLVNPHPTL